MRILGIIIFVKLGPPYPVYGSNPTRPKQICWFYAQGNCRSEYCRFLHENQSVIKIEKSEQNIIQVTKPNQTSYVSGVLIGSKIDAKIETPEHVT